MNLISDNLNSQLNELVGKCFAINRMLDRGMSLLLVRWKLINASHTLHPKVAHAFPSSLFADSISDYQASRNMETIYPATPIGDKNYDTPLEFFVDFYNECVLLQNMIYDAIDTALEEGDHSTKTFLDGLVSRLIPFTDLAQNLVDLVTQYGNDTFHLQVFDSVIDDYVNVPMP